jgi:ribosome biogenesis protein Nip4
LIGEFVNNTDSLSKDEINLLQSWENHHIKGEFRLVKYEPEYAVLMLAEKDKAQKLYAVKGMTTSIAEAMHRQLPVMLETVLLPFEDKIIYDSFIASHSVSFGSGIRGLLEDDYNKAKDEFGITKKL